MTEYTGVNISIEYYEYKSVRIIIGVCVVVCNCVVYVGVRAYW